MLSSPYLIKNYKILADGLNFAATSNALYLNNLSLSKAKAPDFNNWITFYLLDIFYH